MPESGVGGGGVATVGQGAKEAHMSSGDTVVIAVTIIDNTCIMYLKVAKRVNLKNSDHKEINVTM